MITISAGLLLDTRLYRVVMGGSRRVYAKGQTLQTSDYDMAFSLVKSGYVKRYLIANDGTSNVQSIYGPGHFFPLTHAYKLLLNQEISEGPETYHYEAITACAIYSISDDALMDAVNDDPLLFRDLFSVAGRRLQSNILKLDSQALGNSYPRVAHQLLYLAQEFGVDTSLGIKIMLPLTQLELANMLSLTRETVSLSVIRLRKAGIISTGRHIIVRDIERLQDEVYE